MSGKSGNQAKVLDFLVKQNRPMSANDILSNFTGQLTKSVIDKALETLTSDQKIIEKLYGKQKVFMALQNANLTTLSQDLRDLEEKRINAQGELGRLQFDNQRMEKEIKGYGNQVSIGQLERENQVLSNEVEQLKDRLAQYKSKNVQFISKEEKAQIQKEHIKWVKEWRKYKRIATEMVSTIVENCNWSKKKVYEDLCIVTDEEANVQIPSI